MQKDIKDLQHANFLATTIAVSSGLILFILKLIIGFFTQSLSILSEAFHSFTDLLGSFMTFCAIRLALKPPDNDHNFGHGKWENVSGLFEMILIIGLGIFLLYESLKQIITNNITIQSTNEGLIIMAISAITNLFVSNYLLQTASKTDSPALEADGRHIQIDVYTSLGVFIGLVGVNLTGLKIIDPIISTVISIIVLYVGYKIGKVAFKGLLDNSLSKEEEGKIIEIVKKYIPPCSSFHALRTRKAGSQRHIDLHLELPHNISVEDSHNICDMIEKSINKTWQNTSVLIHVEPCDKKCDICNFKEG